MTGSASISNPSSSSWHTSASSGFWACANACNFWEARWPSHPVQARARRSWSACRWTRMAGAATRRRDVMARIRVLLVDDHQLVRAGIRALVEKMADVEVVGEVANGRDALRAVETLRPNLVLMDIVMEGLNGLDATARIVKRFPGIRVIILSMNTGEDSVLQALRAGAAGYLVKGADPVELELAVRAVARGE